ncbi:MAG: DUF3995 domain-containing protein [Bacteroidota bacterium]
MIPSILLSVILTGLGILHFAWAFGVQFGLAQALPTTENGTRVLHPRKIDCALVGLMLTAFAFFYLVKAGFIPLQLPEEMVRYGNWIIPLLFLLRAVGEFKYVGFFKRIRHTEFGKWDTRLFSPLCLTIALLGMLAHLL